MPQINFEILGRKLVNKYPTIAKELIEYPKIYDLKLLPQIKETILTHPRLSNKTATEKKEYFVAVALILYDPDHLAGYKKIRTGLRREISTLFNCSPTLISNLSKKVTILLSIYKFFKADVNYFADMISKEFANVNE
ncbi:MAG: hypothetical protein CVU09_00280 [Bacteroidetes bacterium HGW-Bacteroidetes-4]|jgi:hypothetical protein|nr:MAG: hypothetical protein CVU09_00280 [Bacteroidetes bacterium HGW-Bacteroidetes-4]